MKGIIYYTDNNLEDPLYSLVQKHILEANLPIVSSSLKPIDFGENEVIHRQRGYVTYIKQIISCLERSTAKYIFFCEHDVLYHKSHFDFTPPRDDTFYYNENVWKWSPNTKKIIRYEKMRPLSCMVASRELALQHYKNKEKMINEIGEDKFSSREPAIARMWGYEPGTKSKKRGALVDEKFDTWYSKGANVDVRHKKTFSPEKITIESFRNKPKWWMEANIVSLDFNLEKIVI